MRELTQESFKMTLVKDLGMMYSTNKSTKKKRFAVFLCSVCKKEFKREVAIAKKTTMCVSCKRTLDNPNYKHGECRKNFKSNNYSRWASMMTRCYNKNSTDYHNYGKRGISVKDNFDNFETYNTYIKSLPNANKEGFSIDRIDNNKHYEKGNLRWATKSEQCFNQNNRKNNTGFRGVTKTRYNTFLARITIGNRKRKELGNFKTAEDAFNAIQKYKQENFL